MQIFQQTWVWVRLTLALILMGPSCIILPVWCWPLRSMMYLIWGGIHWIEKRDKIRSRGLFIDIFTVILVVDLIVMFVGLGLKFLPK